MEDDDVTTPVNSTSPSDMDEPKKKCCDIKSWTWKEWLKLFLFLMVVAIFTLAIIYSDTTTTIFSDFLTWMQNNLILGSIVYIIIYTAITVLFVPGSILTLGAGFVFDQALGTVGIFVASIVVMIGACLGALCAFLVGRFCLREQVEALKAKYQTFDTVDKVVGIYGFRIVFLIRLSPAIPFNALNYLLSLTSVTTKDYIFAFPGLYPGTLAYCFIGGSLSALADSASVGFTSNSTVLILTIVGTVIALIGMIAVSWCAKKKYDELKRKIEEDKQNGDVETPSIEQETN